MRTPHPTSWFFLALFAIFLTLNFIVQSAAGQSETGNVNPTLAQLNGLTLVTFGVIPGKIKVYLPDDIRPGDTISGTVATEPNGGSSEERVRNQELLNQYMLELEGLKVGVEQPSFVWTAPAAGGNAHVRYRLNVSDKADSYGYVLEPDTGNKSLGGEWISESKKDHPDFLWYPVGQQGRPSSIYGPFDGRFGNTLIKVGGQDVKLLAESPRRTTFESPTNLMGPLSIDVAERDIKTTGTYRNVGVRLSAPKTNLVRGEQTVLTVEVSGLEGITKPVPLQLEATGVINMDGGNSQSLRITPTEVKRDGIYTTTRVMTGTQAGTFNVTATVIVKPL